jgi:hypothetical protein
MTEMYPNVVAYRVAFAANHGAVGLLYFESGQRDSAMTHYRKAIEIAETWISQHPESHKFTQDLRGT